MTKRVTVHCFCQDQQTKGRLTWKTESEFRYKKNKMIGQEIKWQRNDMKESSLCFRCSLSGFNFTLDSWRSKRKMCQKSVTFERGCWRPKAKSLNCMPILLKGMSPYSSNVISLPVSLHGRMSVSIILRVIHRDH